MLPKGVLQPRGVLTKSRPLADLTWLRVGGPAEYFFQPADYDDLKAFLTHLSPDVPLMVMGVGSNLIVRDGGIQGVVIRLGRGFNAITFSDGFVTAGAAALDAHVAKKSAQIGIDLTFLRTIPGTIGGALAMNAGCYGAYIADHFHSARVILRSGDLVTLGRGDIDFMYRQSNLPSQCVVVDVTLSGQKGDPNDLAQKMQDQLAARDKSQPTKERSAGSTFRNPVGYSSTGRDDDTHDLKAWKVIDDAGLRGYRLGGAQMSELHPNFLLNTGGATAEQLEGLGELVRKKVFQNSGIDLQWEIKRVGDPKSPDT